jgi:hypothetical protein
MPFMTVEGTPGRPAPLTGPMRTRAEARTKYSEIVDDLRTVTDDFELDGFLMDMQIEIAQFEEELPFLWGGDGQDFPGLEQEIEWARARVNRNAVIW